MHDVEIRKTWYFVCLENRRYICEYFVFFNSDFFYGCTWSWGLTILQKYFQAHFCWFGTSRNPNPSLVIFLTPEPLKQLKTSNQVHIWNVLNESFPTVYFLLSESLYSPRKLYQLVLASIIWPCNQPTKKYDFNYFQVHDWIFQTKKSTFKNIKYSQRNSHNNVNRPSNWND